MWYNIAQKADVLHTPPPNKKGTIIMARPVFETQDFERNRLTGAVGYLLFFLPLCANGSSRFCRFCANQGLLGCIAYFSVALAFRVLNLLLGWIPLIGWLVSLAGSVAKVCIVILMAWHGWNAYNGRAEYLPFIGTIELIR